jgi:putative ABC transport system permease protein
VIRTTGDPHLLVRAIQDVIAGIDADQPVTGVATMEEIIDSATAQPAFRSLLISIFAALALLLALIGIYGVMFYAVSQRIREFGIRLSLGARTKDILRAVGEEALPMILIGITSGVVIAGLATDLMKTFLFGVSATDAVTFAGATAGILLAALLACLLPAMRAVRTDPATVLRNE